MSNPRSHTERTNISHVITRAARAILDADKVDFDNVADLASLVDAHARLISARTTAYRTSRFAASEEGPSDQG
ncbi:hypothetical protein [Streptomyces tirandamycinicus]|uniref:hypothetical protein n=1 Tax=Streptomyces tirandamycinicus TaxID=2174846 RepID=UPI0011B1DFAE|nr:hypothetical protein [Streptomyces tirandamycinicus]